MSGSGHISDMNSRMKQNRSKRSKNKIKFKEKSNLFLRVNKKSKKLFFKKPSSEYLKKAKARIKKQFVQQRKKERIALLFLFVLVLAILYFVFKQ